MALGKERAPRVNLVSSLKILATVIAAQNSEKVIAKGWNGVKLFAHLYQDIVNAMLEAKRPGSAFKMSPTGGKEPAHPVTETVAKSKITKLLTDYSAERAHVEGAKNVDNWGNVIVYTEGEGEHAYRYYRELDGDGKPTVKVVLTPENSTDAVLPTITGFVPGQRSKTDFNSAFAETIEAELDIDDILAKL